MDECVSAELSLRRVCTQMSKVSGAQQSTQYLFAYLINSK